MRNLELFRNMGRIFILYLLVFLSSPILCSGLRTTKRQETESTKVVDPGVLLANNSNSSMSGIQRDITTPLPTVPTISPATTTNTSPIITPNSNQDSESPAVTMTPTASTPTTVGSPASSAVSWCVASQSASKTALQGALDYACGNVHADCSAIQPGGSCYYPVSVRDHASYAFNMYYQKNPIPNSCNFQGTAVLTSTNPSTRTCQYPSTSTRSSILNTTISTGSRIYGSVPSGPSSSSSAEFSGISYMYIIMCLCIYFSFK